MIFEMTRNYDIVLPMILAVAVSIGIRLVAPGTLDVNAGQAVVAHAGEWVRYSTPLAGGAEYIAVCLPAFSPDTVHRDA